MEIVLMVVTVVSLLLAFGMSVVGWTLLRGDRRRSAARVEALGVIAAADVEPEPEAQAVPASARFMSIDNVEPAVESQASAFTDAWDIEPEPWVDPDRREPAPRRHETALVAARTRSTRPAPPPLSDVVSSEMFAGGAVEHRAPTRRWLALAAVTVVMAAGAGVVYTVYKPALLSAAGTNDLPSAAPSANARPLDLLSLTHTTDPDGNFSLTGLVQNPTGGGPMRNVVVVVYLFDRGGNYFASGKAALDLTSLQPGNESPFVVRVPNGKNVGRFRVGFRLEDGRVVAHVDRRGQPLEGTTEVDNPARAPGTARVKGVPGA
jgi:hypothetical protein